MTYRIVLAAMLAIGLHCSAAAQTAVRRIEFRGAAPAPAATAPAKATAAPFGCEARAGQVCHFQIFYQGGRGRVVVLPAGMKQSIPNMRIGGDSYCVGMNRRPAYDKCARKVINANYNY